MMTLRQFAAKPGTIPAATGWYLADLGEVRRKGACGTVALGAEVRVVPSCEGISEGIVLTGEKLCGPGNRFVLINLHNDVIGLLGRACRFLLPRR